MRVRLWLLLLLGCSGCAAAVGAAVGGAVGAGSVAYLRGSYAKLYPARFERVWEALPSAIRAVGGEVLRTRGGRLRGTLWACCDRHRVCVKVRATDVEVTRVTVRVGIFGDRLISRRIHAALGELLAVR